MVLQGIDCGDAFNVGQSEINDVFIVLVVQTELGFERSSMVPEMDMAGLILALHDLSRAEGHTKGSIAAIQQQAQVHQVIQDGEQTRRLAPYGPARRSQPATTLVCLTGSSIHAPRAEVRRDLEWKLGDKTTECAGCGHMCSNGRVAIKRRGTGIRCQVGGSGSPLV